MLKRLSLPLMVLFLFPLIVLAGIDDVVPTEQWVLQLVGFISSAKGLSVLALAAGATQLLMLLFQTPIGNLAGKWRLSLVALFSLAFVLIGALVSGMPIGVALFSAPVLAALQVFLNQIYKQFFQKSH